ncbi:MAG: serine/threonine-protein kinase [Planctomycetota bacterium]
MSADDEPTQDSLAQWNAWLAAGDDTSTGSLEAFAAAAEAFDGRETGLVDFEVESDPRFDAEPVLLEPGARFAAFEIRACLGSGGMATVYRAWDTEHEEEVALKLLHRGLVEDPRHLQRFRREARVASRLNHPQIVCTKAYGEVSGAAYISMPVVEGPTLEEYVEAQGPLPPQEAARTMIQIARALQAAHDQGVVHRDLKPSNVVLHPTRGPLILDFGLAKHLTRDPRLTETGEILGTPTYLAPEQVSPPGKPLDHRIDVYGLGGMLFFLVSGQPPRPGESAIKVLRDLLHRDAPRLQDVLPQAPAALDRVCAKALARDPADRYASADLLADDLERFLGAGRVSARLPGPLTRAWRSVRGHPYLSATVVCAALAGAAALQTVSTLAARVDRHERSAVGLRLLEEAEAFAARGDYPQADRTFLQAMLSTKEAFHESPQDPILRTALARVERARVAYAERRGEWSLAEALRHDLKSLDADPELLPRSDAPCVLTVAGLEAPHWVELFSVDGGEPRPVGKVHADSPEISLRAGSYWATERDAHGVPVRAFLVVADPNHRHVVQLDRVASPPPGVYRLPAGAVLGGQAQRGTHAD